MFFLTLDHFASDHFDFRSFYFTLVLRFETDSSNSNECSLAFINFLPVILNIFFYQW